MAGKENLHPNLSNNLSVFTLEIGHQNLLLFYKLRHNSALIAYFPEVMSILEKMGPKILERLLIIYLFVAR